MFKLLPLPVLTWQALLAAAAYGVLEWLALSRSRALDRLAMRRGGPFRR